MFFCLFSFQYKFYMSFENINSFTRCAHKGKVMFGCMNCDFLYIQIWKGCRQLRIYVSRLLQLPLLCTWGNKCCSTAKLWKGAIFFPYWLHNSCCKHIKRRTDRDRDAKRERKKNCERMAVKRIISYKPDSLFYHLKRLKKCVLQFNTHKHACVCVRELTYVKTLHNALIMISSRADGTLGLVCWDKGALMQRGGVTEGNGTDKMSLLSEVTGCRFSPASCQQRCHRRCIWGASARCR